MTSLPPAQEVNAFTSDDRAPESFNCERCGVFVKKGNEWGYFKNPAGRDKRTCKDCKRYYSKGVAQCQDTLSRSRSTSSSTHSGMIEPLPNPDMIASRVNAAQRANASREMSHVTPMSNSGPYVSLPNLSRSSAVLSGPHGYVSRPRATGYSPAHQHHSAQTDLWRSKAYAPSGETVAVNITVGHATEGKTGHELLNGISDSIRDLDVNLTVPEVRHAVLDLMKPKINQFSAEIMGFCFKFDEFNLREISKSLNVDMDGPTLDRRTPYFRPQCMKADKKTNQLKFHRPSTPFRLLLLISAKEWDRYESLLEAQAHANDLPIIRTTSTSSSHSSWAKGLQSIPSTATSSALNTASPKTSAAISSVSMTDLIGDDSDTARTSAKRPRSTSSVTPTTPPRAKRAPAPFLSPTENRITSALIAGGLNSDQHSDISSLTTMQGLVAPIPTVSFLDIINLDNVHTRFIFDNAVLSSVAHLQADLRFESELGVGAFKTCHPAKLICSEQVMTANSVVMKELYKNKGLRENGKVVNRGRYSRVVEFDGIMIEANVHYYAVALMEFAYAYIERQKLEKGLPDLPIPNLRYVEAAVFMVQNNEIRHSRSSTAGPKRTYLLEERIALPPGQDFIKYIHNSSPLPAIPPEHPEYNTALFLAAVQHLQYEKTYQSAYVSDFQGYGGLLSDPQIMTSPLVFLILGMWWYTKNISSKLLQVIFGEGAEAAALDPKTSLFGDGNVQSGFEKFPLNHQCEGNPFCAWMELKPLQNELQDE
ncbi:hypothetical protein D9758_003915 [Tetrapyrgos nigripes]|uniref:Alpha-type protein kinase domain-containing protein n=1 Tax=Tetrapyrgos nigripes TaxID=182062 RepID=A0A8H5LRP4_9AGAR|nr:hypothetical protein D9758_003915 [Tetrapyrgos nigripes]